MSPQWSWINSNIVFKCMCVSTAVLCVLGHVTMPQSADWNPGGGQFRERRHPGETICPPLHLESSTGRTASQPEIKLCAEKAEEETVPPHAGERRPDSGDRRPPRGSRLRWGEAAAEERRAPGVRYLIRPAGQIQSHQQPQPHSGLIVDHSGTETRAGRLHSAHTAPPAGCWQTSIILVGFALKALTYIK